MITYIITYKLEKQKERRAVNQKCSHKGATPKVCNASRKIDATKICFQPTCWKHDIYIYIYIYISVKNPNAIPARISRGMIMALTMTEKLLS